MYISDEQAVVALSTEIQQDGFHINVSRDSKRVTVSRREKGQGASSHIVIYAMARRIAGKWHLFDCRGGDDAQVKGAQPEERLRDLVPKVRFLLPKRPSEAA